MKYLLAFVTAVLMVFSVNAEIDPERRTAAPGIMVLPSQEPAAYMMRYLVYFTPREGNIYYRWMDINDGEWSEWSECGKVVVFNTPGTYTVETYAKRPGKSESAHLSATFTVAYNGMSVSPGVSLRLQERGYQVSMNSLYAYDIYYRWKAEGESWNMWKFYQDDVLFTEIGRYTLEARCDFEDGYDYVSVTFEVDRAKAGDVELLPGDVNLDGVVNIADVTALISVVLGNTPEIFYKEVADLNGDGMINISDVTALISLVLNKK